jgi:RHS repeat-associated protein
MSDVAAGEYHFRAYFDSVQFWSDEVDQCTIPGCLNASITVTIPMTVTVQSQTGSSYPDLPVYVFSGESYTGFHGISDGDGQVAFTLPEGSYRFRADYDGVQFWSDEVDHCTIPGCLEAQVEIPGGVGEVSVTIDYEYDPLYRLTEADYSTGEYFWYTYDAVGNRLTQETHEGTNTYAYDIANRLVEVDGVPYTWDANGNLLSDGVSTYTYNHANRLTGVIMGEDSYTFAYNGLGDRLGQTINGEATNYTLDLVAGLTQVLDDGSNAYLYGLTRIGEEQPAGWALHIPDALGSVRQLTDSNAVVTLAQSFEPFGSVLASSGLGETQYSFTGEWADGTGLVQLRARYYVPASGRFLSRDEWNGNSKTPMSFNSWLYVYGNPVNYTDESGNMVRPWDPPITVCAHCNLIKGSEARKACFIDCLCGIKNNDADMGYPTTCPGGECELLGMFNISMYYIPNESQSRFSKELWGTDVVRLYRGGELMKVGSTEEQVKAKRAFLYSNEGVCMQGTGKLIDGRYIECASTHVNWAGNYMPSEYEMKRIRFDLSRSAKRAKLERLKTVAASESSNVPMDIPLYIPGLIGFMEAVDPGYSGRGIFRRTDSGGGLAINTLDIYVGEGSLGYSAYDALMGCQSPYPNSDFWNTEEGITSCPLPYMPIPDLFEVYKVKN